MSFCVFEAIDDPPRRHRMDISDLLTPQTSERGAEENEQPANTALSTGANSSERLESGFMTRVQTMKGDVVLARPVEEHVSHINSVESSTSGDADPNGAFNCDVCQRRYSTKGNLTVHRKTVHMGERKFDCEDCGRSFATKFGRDRHEQMVHVNSRPFFCHVCRKCFKTKNCIRRHMRISHNL